MKKKRKREMSKEEMTKSGESEEKIIETSSNESESGIEQRKMAA